MRGDNERECLPAEAIIRQRPLSGCRVESKLQYLERRESFGTLEMAKFAVCVPDTRWLTGEGRRF